MHALPELDPDLDPAEVVRVLGGVLGAVRAARLDAIAAGRLRSVAAVLEDFLDPHNAGAALRSCEGMGVDRVHVVAARNRFRTSVRVTQGCERWLDLHRHETSDACVDALHAAGFAVLAAVPEATDSLWAIDPRRPVALAFGNEHLGLSPRLRERADGQFAIPMYGASQSLNVSVSVAIALHVTTELRRRALGRPGELDGEALLRLRARYYFADLRGARAIVLRARETGTSGR